MRILFTIKYILVHLILTKFFVSVVCAHIHVLIIKIRGEFEGQQQQQQTLPIKFYVYYGKLK